MTTQQVEKLARRRPVLEAIDGPLHGGILAGLPRPGAGRRLTTHAPRSPAPARSPPAGGGPATRGSLPAPGAPGPGRAAGARPRVWRRRRGGEAGGAVLAPAAGASRPIAVFGPGGPPPGPVTVARASSVGDRRL